MRRSRRRRASAKERHSVSPCSPSTTTTCCLVMAEAKNGKKEREPVEHERFDTIVRALNAGPSFRRTALRLLAGSVLGAVDTSAGSPADTSATGRQRCPKRRRCAGRCCRQGQRCAGGRCVRHATCSPLETSCAVDAECCTGVCSGVDQFRVCTCNVTGVSCAAGAECCSGVCTAGQCACGGQGTPCNTIFSFCCSGLTCAADQTGQGTCQPANP